MRDFFGVFHKYQSVNFQIKATILQKMKNKKEAINSLKLALEISEHLKD
jgi:hypothetical protein